MATTTAPVEQTAPVQRLSSLESWSLLWALIPALAEVQQHNDKHRFLEALTFGKVKMEEIYGPQLGAVFEA